MKDSGAGQPPTPGSRVPTVVFYDIRHEAATRVRAVLRSVARFRGIPAREGHGFRRGFRASPTQHSFAVDAFLTRQANPNLTPPLDTEYLAAQVHTHLSGALGTGTEHTTAGALITAAEALPDGADKATPLRSALIHAIRAAR
ncbi:hypothetical protein RS86_01098 [Microbacterium azadirachtae]|uniref:Uncharacterized protein n=1 Tax=Microbacterium azadirachtae TaxID=582680 RepID=A0A0F0LS36_9MICO|nr:hypothetical protein RS86_01098 [Microbacterium azadirachtae]